MYSWSLRELTVLLHKKRAIVATFGKYKYHRMTETAWQVMKLTRELPQ
jgi:hypothetical protein